MWNNLSLFPVFGQAKLFAIIVTSVFMLIACLEHLIWFQKMGQTYTKINLNIYYGIQKLIRAKIHLINLESIHLIARFHWN